MEFHEGEEVPKASVIVYCFINEDSLMEYLDVLMNQDYPNYEVILINEGGLRRFLLSRRTAATEISRTAVRHFHSAGISQCQQA